MAVAVDKLTSFVARSMVEFLRGSPVVAAASLTGVHILSQTFRHEKAPAGSRTPPYVGVRWLTDETMPLYVGPHTPRERLIAFDLWVVCADIQTQLIIPQQVHQVISSNDVIVDPGPPVQSLPTSIPLLDFDGAPDPGPYPTVGPIEVILGQIRPLIDEVDQTSNDKRNRRILQYTSLIGWSVSLEKLRDAKLLA